jgi:hypothetical protein
MAALLLVNSTGNFCLRHAPTYEVTLDDTTAAFAQKMPIEQVINALGDVSPTCCVIQSAISSLVIL